MSKVTVRAYNVGFGDAILVTVPDRNPSTRKETTRNVLIDVGIKKGIGGASLDDLKTVVLDIRKRLDGRGIDLYVMTHEHYDHVAGLFHAKDTWGLDLEVDYSWITASANPAFLRRNPAIRELRQRMRLYCEDVERRIAFAPDSASKALMELLRTRESQKTESCVRYLRGLARKRTTFVHADTRIKAGTHHPFREAQLRILAPEKDTWRYFRRLNITPLAAYSSTAPPASAAAPSSASLRPPKGVDPDAFGRLLDRWDSGVFETVLAVNAAENNTSIVFVLEWRGWRLLFTGDAEKASWRVMEERGVLKPIHFLKVSHHGSETGAPGESQLEVVLPESPPDSRSRYALVSTRSGSKAYPGIPDRNSLSRLRKRCKKVFSTEDVRPGSAISVAFAG